MTSAEKAVAGALTWTTKTVALSPGDAAAWIGIHASAVVSAARKMQAIEGSRTFTTRDQLARVHRNDRRALIIVSSTRPPTLACRGEDFRMRPVDVPACEAAKLGAPPRM